MPVRGRARTAASWPRLLGFFALLSAACEPLLGDTARAFSKSAKQKRAAGQELRAMLG